MTLQNCIRKSHFSVIEDDGAAPYTQDYTRCAAFDRYGLDPDWEEDDFIPANPQEIMNEHVKLWNGYRDPNNGLYCERMVTTDTVQCGGGNYVDWKSHYYNAASTGFGLVIDAIQAELGLITQEQARQRALKVC